MIDLIDREAIYFDGEKGEDVRREPIPADMVEAAERARQGMLEALSMVSDEIMELLLEEQEVPLDLIHKTIREGTIAQQICPVMVGSAYKNKGVQPLLDAVSRYLPSPLDREIFAKDNNNGMAEVPLAADPDAPLVAMAFKLVEEPFGQVTYMRIYQGTLQKGKFYFNTRQRKQARISRILRVHADQKEDIDSAGAGDIVAVMGIECATGDTYCSEGTERLAREHLRRRAGHRPVDPAGQAGRLRQALQGPEPVHARGPDLPRPRRPGDQRDDHLGHGRAPPGDLRRADPPRVQGRVHRRRAQGQLPRGADQGDAVQLQAQEADRRLGPVRPRRRQAGSRSTRRRPEPFVFENKVTGGRIPTEYIPSVEKGFRESLHKGPVAGYEVIGVKMRARGRLVPRRRLVDHGLRDLRPRLLPRDLPEGRPGPARADHEGRGRDPDRVPGAGHRRDLVQAGRDPRHREPLGLHRHHRRGARSPRCSATPTTSGA